jgi:hypothetical protein
MKTYTYTNGNVSREVTGEQLFILLSNEYIESAHVYKWKCSVGHIFEKQFSNMKFRNEFCPECEGRKKRKKRA